MIATLLLVGTLNVLFVKQSKAREQAIVHIGDLVIDGNQTFIIEKSTYVQTGDIIIKDNATLVLRDSRLILNLSANHEYSILVQNSAEILSTNTTIATNGTLVYEINFYENSYGLFNTSKIELHGTIRGYDHTAILVINSQAFSVQSYGHSNTVIRNSTLWGAVCVAEKMSFPHLSVFDSTLETVNLYILGAIATADGLRNGHVVYFNTYYNLTISGGWVGATTIFNSNVRLGIGLSFRNSTATISRGFLSYIDVLDHSDVYIYNSTINAQAIVRHDSNIIIQGVNVLMFNPWDDSFATVLDSEITFFGTGYGNASSFVSNSTISQWEVKDFLGEVTFENVAIKGILEIASSHFHIYGNVTFPSVNHWENSNVTRNFNVILSNESGYPMASVELELVDGSDKVIWNGFSDDLGRANFNLTLSDGNYTDALRIKASKGTRFSTKFVTFCSETPILMVLTKPISIYTDKYSYSAGDTMYLGLDVTNPLDYAITVCIAIWSEIPDGSICPILHAHAMTLPAGFIYSNPDLLTFMLPNVPAGVYTLHAALLEPTVHAILVEDIAEWQFS